MPLLLNDRRFAELTISIGAMLTSLVLSVIHLAFDPLPNPDGVVYLLAAQAWLDEGYGAAAAIYPLPVYSILIAWAHAASGLGLLTSAHCLDAFLIAGSVVGLQRLVAALGGTVRAQLIVVVLVLLLPELNGYRSFLLRDFAYWMFALFALVLLVHHSIAPTFSRAAGFVAMCGFAAAFRAEAILLLVATPLALPFGEVGRRAFVMLAICASVVAASVALVFVALSAPPSTVWLVQTLHQAISLAAEVPGGMEAQIAGFGAHVLDPRFHDYAASGVAGGLVAMIAVHVCNAASLPLTAIAIAGLATGVSGCIDRRGARIVFAAFGVSILALAAVLMARGIIQTRYAMPSGLLLLVIAAFAIDSWYARANSPSTRLRRASTLLVVYLLGEAAFGLFNSKHQYVDAARWLAQHTEPNARIFSTDLRVLYLADRPVNWRNPNADASAAMAPAGTYDYWVVNAARDGAEADAFASTSGVSPVVQFANRKGQALRIYAASSPTTEPGLVR
ncbi:MAG TPA: hypothetical protein VL379_16480 [Pseudomonadales bacterium]|nr:hypothetical protein [Pseudomonadales bacterium]